MSTYLGITTIAFGTIGLTGTIDISSATKGRSSALGPATRGAPGAYAHKAYTDCYMTLTNNTDSGLMISWPNTGNSRFCPAGRRQSFPIPYGEDHANWTVVAQPAVMQRTTNCFVEFYDEIDLHGNAIPVDGSL